MPDLMHGNHEDDNDDEPLTLDPSTLEALADFYTERDTRLEQFEDLKAQAEEDVDSSEELDIDTLFAEDWNASQFWETATILANELLSDCTEETCIAVVSAPSVFIQLRNILVSCSLSILAKDPSTNRIDFERSTPTATKPQVNLFEYDKRFSVFREFVPYDFEHPLRLPGELKGRFDRIICDPPFLSEDCQTKSNTNPPCKLYRD
ncbi:MAG: hypothetical protein M1824_004245 [Vezdaea acicularis]|nr:MAG: hypothetical protein M1824_004245 [Vezdaea acicularis]